MNLNKEKNRRCPECGSGTPPFQPSRVPLLSILLFPQSTPSTTRGLRSTATRTTKCFPACFATLYTTGKPADKSNPCFPS